MFAAQLILLSIEQSIHPCFGQTLGQKNKMTPVIECISNTPTKIQHAKLGSHTKKKIGRPKMSSAGHLKLSPSIHQVLKICLSDWLARK